jgi:predicted amidohydrolase YtcJ
VSRTTHLHSGIIILDASLEKYASTITFHDGAVIAIDGKPPKGALLVDLQGQTLVPGFVDSHIHLLLGSSGAGDVNLSGCENKNDFERELLQGYKGEDDSQWLVASGWSEQTLDATPTIEWLDCIQDIPVLCWRSDFHTAVLNTAALNQLNLAALEKVTGGAQCKQGIVRETALWEHVAPFIPSPSAAQIRTRLKKAVQNLHADGVTLVGAMEELDDVENYLFPLREELQVRMRLMLLDHPTPENFSRCSSSEKDSLLHVIGFKTFLDGTLGSRTAKMYEPFCDVDSSGLFVEHALQGDLGEWISRVVQGGYAPVMHAIGDEAVGTALKSIANVPKTQLCRIEHAQFIAEQDSSAIEGRWFGVQPLHKESDDLIALDAVGEERANQLHDWRAMLDRGAKLSFGSDWPIAPHNPIGAMSAAIKNGVTPKEALVATTADAAASLGEPRSGILKIGSFADATLLSCNPLECDWNSVTPSITMTIVGGVIQFQSGTNR